jgi:hypothetical protein
MNWFRSCIFSMGCAGLVACSAGDAGQDGDGSKVPAFGNGPATQAVPNAATGSTLTRRQSLGFWCSKRRHAGWRCAGQWHVERHAGQ